VIVDDVGGNGIYIECQDQTSEYEQNYTIEGCDIISVGRDGIKLNNEAHDTLINGCDIEDCGAYGVKASSAIYNLTVNECYIEDNANKAVQVNSTSEGTVIADNQFESNGTNSTLIESAYHFAITGNLIQCYQTRSSSIEGTVRVGSIGENTLRGSTYPFSIRPDGTGYDVSITGNNIQHQPDDHRASKAITLRGTGLTATENTVVATGTGATVVDVMGCTTADNIFRIDPSGSGEDQETGVYVQTASNFDAHDNTVQQLNNQPNYGFHFTTASQDGLLHDNLLGDAATGIDGSPDANIVTHDN